MRPTMPPDGELATTYQVLRAVDGDDMAAIRTAYNALTRVGNATADADTWNVYLDRAHHALGLLLAFRLLADRSDADAGQLDT
jgi:hypothetical protein